MRFTVALLLTTERYGLPITRQLSLRTRSFIYFSLKRGRFVLIRVDEYFWRCRSTIDHSEHRDDSGVIQASFISKNYRTIEYREIHKVGLPTDANLFPGDAHCEILTIILTILTESVFPVIVRFTLATPHIDRYIVNAFVARYLESACPRDILIRRKLVATSNLKTGTRWI